MKIKINGKEVDVSGAMSVSDLLVVQKVKMPDMVSVELNGEILERSTFGATTIKENDAVEFLYFMGGGSGRGPRRAAKEEVRASL